MARITESQLVLPALYLMDSAPIDMSSLIEKLTEIFNPQGEDLAILPGRTDTKFSQIVRNLKSHNTLENLGFVTYERASEHGTPLSLYKITDKGRAYLEENQEILQYLINNGFAYEDLKTSFDRVTESSHKKHVAQPFEEGTTVIEGSSKIVQTKVYVRSAKLRQAAIEHYTTGGRIQCKACCFDFVDFYGMHGQGFIEIHHLKPVFMFAEDDLNKTITQALENVIPVCANCHRMIHRAKIPLSLVAIKELITPDLSFCR